MSTYYRIKKLASEKHISISQLERTLGLSNGSVSKWDKSKPNSKYLEKVADYFGVSTDYLLGRTDKRHYYDLNKKDEQDIQEKLQDMLNGLTDTESLSYLKNGGEKLSQNDAELLASSLENVIRQSKIMSKKKFTPKKYRHNESNDNNN